MTGYIGALRGSLKAHSSYFQSLEVKDMFYRVSTGQSGDKDRQPEATAVKKSVAAIQMMQGKLTIDLPFAKREIAWGYLGPDDLQEMSRLLRGVMLPLSGLSSVVDIFERLAELNGWDENQDEESLEIGARDLARRRVVEDWNDVMQTVHEPFQSVIQAMDEGLEHAMLRLRLKTPPKKAKNKSESSENVDVEGKADESQPGEDGFADFLERKTDEFYLCKELALKEWCKRKGIDVPDDFFSRPCDYNIDDTRRKQGENFYERSQRSLYALLYVCCLTSCFGHGLTDSIRLNTCFTPQVARFLTLSASPMTALNLGSCSGSISLCRAISGARSGFVAFSKRRMGSVVPTTAWETLTALPLRLPWARRTGGGRTLSTFRRRLLSNGLVTVYARFRAFCGLPNPRSDSVWLALRCQLVGLALPGLALARD